MSFRKLWALLRLVIFNSSAIYWLTTACHDLWPSILFASSWVIFCAESIGKDIGVLRNE